MPTTSPYSTPRHALIIAGTDEAGKPAEYLRHQRIEAVWAVGHDLAAEAYGADNVPTWFGPDGGNKLMRELQEAPAGTTAEVMVGMVKRHLKIEDKAPDKAAPETTP